MKKYDIPLKIIVNIVCSDSDMNKEKLNGHYPINLFIINLVGGIFLIRLQ